MEIPLFPAVNELSKYEDHPILIHQLPVSEICFKLRHKHENKEVHAFNCLNSEDVAKKHPNICVASGYQRRAAYVMKLIQ